MNKAIPIGYEDFKQIIDKDLYYVDKTLMIKELIDGETLVNLFTRPRRFGKTLNLSMIRRFFEDERTEQGQRIDNRYLFDGLAIAGAGERYTAMRQQYPVISLSLKSARQPNYQMAYESLLDEIAKEYKRHRYILTEDMALEKEQYLRIMNKDAKPIEYAKALEFLSQCLARYHQKNTIILIDEYDVPLENAYFAGFYDQMIAFIRSLFESALKTNASLEFGVITGCLRISKESIFTGLNNLKINSVTSNSYGDAFGFLQEEVDQMLDFYGISGKREEVKSWYDGYRFGSWEIYNPWSIINYVDETAKDDTQFPKPYWSNTSSNSIIREMVEEADSATRRELEVLIEGGTVEKPVHEDITYEDIHESTDNLWNFLFFTGYLKECGKRQIEEQIYLQLSIPNKEIRSVYRQSILTWFDKKLRRTDRRPLLTALEEGDCEGAADFVSDLLMGTISFFDYGENYYHGFLAGLLAGFDEYEILSNRESGIGRADLILRTMRVRMGKAIILEVKVAQKVSEMKKKCQDALTQIEENRYEENLRNEGYPSVEKYGICFYRKECMIMKAD